jgi:hypothetical protein
MLTSNNKTGTQVALQDASGDMIYVIIRFPGTPRCTSADTRTDSTTVPASTNNLRLPNTYHWKDHLKAVLGVLESVLGVLRWRQRSSMHLAQSCWMPGSNLPAGTQNIPSEERLDTILQFASCSHPMAATLDSRNGAVWLTQRSIAITLLWHRHVKQVAATSRTDRSLCFEQDRAVRGHVRGHLRCLRARCIPAPGW